MNFWGVVYSIKSILPSSEFRFTKPIHLKTNLFYNQQAVHGVTKMTEKKMIFQIFLSSSRRLVSMPRHTTCPAVVNTGFD